MAIPTGSYLDEQSQAIQEVLSRDVKYLSPTHDPMFSLIVNGAADGSGPWGRDLRIRKTWHTGYTGVVDQGASREDFALYGDTSGSSNTFGDSASAKLFSQENTHSFPNPLDGKMQRPIRMNIGLRSSLTNLYWTLGELQAEATEAFISSDLSLKLKGFANKIAHIQANYLWLSQNDNYRLFTLTTGDTTVLDDDYSPGSSNNAILEVTPSNLTCDRLHPGMRVNLVAGSGASGDYTSGDLRTSNGTGNTTEIVVVNVDPLVNKVFLRWGDGAAWSEGYSDSSNRNYDQTDYVVFPGSKGSGGNFKGFAGINSWIKTGASTISDDENFLLGGESSEFGGADERINVRHHPEFRSGGWDFKNRPITERRLRQICRRFYMAHGKYGHTLDSFHGSDGVWQAYERQWSVKETLDRTNNIATVQKGQGMAGDGYSNFNFTMDGKNMKGYIHRNIDANTVYGLKTSNGNWKMYTPPDYPGLKKDSQIGGKYAAFRFVGNALQGADSIKFPLYNTSGTHGLPTEGMQTPGMIRQNLVPDQIPGIKLTNVEEDRTYADDV